LARPHYYALAKRIVRFANAYWFYNEEGVWEEVGARADLLRSMVYNLAPTYEVNGQALMHNDQTIGQFLKDGLVVFDRQIYLPLAPQFVTVDGKKCINKWVDGRRVGDDDDIAECEPILRLIRESLCGQQPISMDAMLAELQSKERTEFRWVCHWLALLYWKPGIRLQSNCWFIGESQGIGKGTLIQIMRELLGSAHVNQVSEEELARGWSDHIGDTLLLEADEFKDSDMKSMQRFLKRVTTNPKINLTKRNKGVINVPWNSTHWVFSTNEVFAFLVEANNRRDMLIATINPKDARLDEWKGKALELNRRRGRPEYSRMLSGFAALLSMLGSMGMLDEDFVTFPISTELKRKLIVASKDMIGVVAEEILTMQEGNNLEEKIIWWTVEQGVRPSFNDTLLLKDFREAMAARLGRQIKPFDMTRLKDAGLAYDAVFKSVRTEELAKKPVAGLGVRIPASIPVIAKPLPQ
jgi:hypothetical protein